MALLAGAAAVALVGGLVQAWQSEKARGANSKRMKEIEKLFSQITPPGFDASLNDGPEFIMQKLGDAGLDMSKITPEQFKVVGQYAPEAAAFVAEQNPTLVERSATGKEGVQAQLDALRKYKEIAKGDDPAFRAKLAQAMDASQANAQSRTQSLLQDAARRGTSNSGQNFASILQGNSDAMQMGGQAGRDAAIASYQNQMNALGQSASLGGQVAGQDLAMQESNADIINQFNQRTSKNYQAYLNNRANLANEAQLFNLKNAQDTANSNTAAKNDANKFNLTNRNALLQQQYGNQVNERDYQNNIAKYNAEWARDEKARANQLQQMNFGNQIALANGRAGIGGQAMAMNTQNAADRNQIVSGVTNAISGGLMAKYAADQEDARWDKYLAARNGGLA